MTSQIQNDENMPSSFQLWSPSPGFLQTKIAPANDTPVKKFSFWRLDHLDHAQRVTKDSNDGFL